MKEYDLIIVGGGPAGLAAGIFAAKKGLEALIVDKRQEIGVPVRCGEGLGRTAIKKMGLDPQVVGAQSISQSIVYAPDGKEHLVSHGKNAGYILERHIFEKQLAIKAAESGAKILVKTTATDIIKEDGFVKGIKAKIMGRETEFRGKIILSADGIESKIGKLAGINTVNKSIDMDAGFQYEMVGVKLKNPEAMEFYFGSEVAPRGYIWIFPKGKTRANVGIGIGGHIEKTARHYLDKFVQSRQDLKNASIIEVNGGGIPVGGFLKNMVGNGIMLIGDAAHQVNPIHGGGIELAMDAAEMAVDVAEKAIKEGDVSGKRLSEYNDTWWKTTGDRMMKVQKVREILDNLDDETFNQLAEVLTEETIKDIVLGKNVKTIAKLFMKKPGLIKIAGKLL